MIAIETGVRCCVTGFELLYGLAICMFLWTSVYSGPLCTFQSGFFFLTLSCMSSLCNILGINFLSDILFANIFPHSGGGLFHFVEALLCCTELFSLIQTHLFIFGFVSPA